MRENGLTLHERENKPYKTKMTPRYKKKRLAGWDTTEPVVQKGNTIPNEAKLPQHAPDCKTSTSLAIELMHPKKPLTRTAWSGHRLTLAQ